MEQMTVPLTIKSGEGESHRLKQNFTGVSCFYLWKIID